MSLIQFKIQDRIGTIAFDDYRKRNALSADLIAEMIKALKRIEAEKAKVVILRSSSNNPVWSAGHDISELSPSILPFKNFQTGALDLGILVYQKDRLTTFQPLNEVCHKAILL